MSYPRNAASPPPVLVGQVIQISDGAVQTSGASVRVRTGTGSWGAGAGTLACDATSGFWDYLPTQAETNAESFEVAVYKASCLGCGQSVVTSASSTAGYAGTDHAKIANPTTTVNLSGTTIKTATDVEADTQDLQARIPAALVGGRIDASVGAYQSGMTPLQPTVAGRTLDVSAGGEAGIDWANIGSPTTTVVLSGTTISPSQKVDVETIKTQSVACASSVTVGAYVGGTGAALPATSYSAPPSATTIASQVRTELSTELLVVTHLGTAIELDGSVYRFTANALELAPSSSGGDATAANQTTIINHLTAIKGAGFSGSSDSLEAISDAVAGLAVSSGSGAYTITITVNDGATALQGATVRVTEGATTIVGTTNANGVVTFALDAATWSLAITKAGYSYTPTTLTVSATASFTRSMTAVSIDPPAGPGLSTGVITCYGTNGLAESGALVYIALESGPGDDGAALDSATLTLTANGSGIASHTGFVRGATYKARRGTNGAWVRFVVPNEDSFDIAELVGSP